MNEKMNDLQDQVFEPLQFQKSESVPICTTKFSSKRSKVQLNPLNDREQRVSLRSRAKTFVDVIMKTHPRRELEP